MICAFHAYERPDGTWEVRDAIHAVIDSLPTLVAAENIALELNRAYRRGYCAAQENMRQAIGAV